MVKLTTIDELSIEKVTTLENPMIGYKLIEKCRETTASAFWHGRSHQPKVFEQCIMMIGTPTGARVVRQKDDPEDMRTDKISVLKMTAKDGTECMSGKPWIFSIDQPEYRLYESYVTRLDTSLNGDACKPGFHFWPTPPKLK